MSEKYSAFSYKAGNSLIHKMPACGKIIFLPLMSIAIFSLPPFFSLTIFFLQIVLSFCLHFTIREQLKDLKPGLYYSILLIIYSLLSSLIAGLSAGSALSEINFGIDSASIFMLIKLFCLLQTASILYRTSTSLEIREGCEKIEIFICRILHLPCKKTVSNAISLFINFIPLVYSIWNQSKKAWYARQGKRGIRMYITLLPVLFSVGMKKAYNMAKALQIKYSLATESFF